MQRSTVQIPLDTITINCTIEEIAATYSWLLMEMRGAIPRLRPDERTVLRQIMTHASKSLTVHYIFPEFTRESEAHKTLRRLRAAQFIRPARTGRWEPHEPIELKPFGFLIWKQCGEESLFGDRGEESPAEGGDGSASSPVIDLASPGVDAVESNEPILEVNEELVECDDDLRDLLTFAKDDKA